MEGVTCGDDRYDELFRFDMSRDMPHYRTILSLDLHPTKPWILTSWSSCYLKIWKHRSKTMSKYFQASEYGFVRSAKFVARKHWVVAGGDDMSIYVYNYNTMDRIKVFKAHTRYIRCVVVHPTLPYVLSSSEDMLIKLWDWDNCWVCARIFVGHSDYVMQVAFNPKDTNIFASASLDRTIKIWNLGSSNPKFTLDAHEKGVNCLDYCTGGDTPYLISGSDDHTAKVWDYQTKRCVQILEGHTDNVSTACFHPKLPLIITGSLDGAVCFWDSTTYRLENTKNYGVGLGPIGFMKGSPRVAIVCGVWVIVVKLGCGMPVASMDNSGNIIWAYHYKIQTTDTRQVIYGKRLPLTVKELATCDIYPQYLKHNPNGSLVAVWGDGEYAILTSRAWRHKSYGHALEFVWSSEGEYAVRESTSKIQIFSKTFQEKKSIRPTFSAERIYGGTLLAICSNDFICFYDWAECRLICSIEVNVKNLFWADSGDLVAITSNTSFFILKYNKAGPGNLCYGMTKKVMDIQNKLQHMFSSTNKSEHGILLSYLERERGPIDEQGVEDAFKLLHETNERVRTGLWVGDCFIYTNSFGRLNYCVGGEVTTMFYMDRPMYLLGYHATQTVVYLIDKEFNVRGCTLPLSLIEYKSLFMCEDFERANALLPNIPKVYRDSVAHFLESKGMIEDALDVATDPDYRFELATQCGRLEMAKEIASEVQSQSKWKQLGELTMSTGKFEMAEECLKRAMDFSGLLLLYSSIGDAEGMCKLANLAQEQGKNNVAFLCLFMLGKLEECLQLLVDTNRIPEAALMARSYLPSRVSEIVGIWRKDLSKINPKVAETLADPQEHPSLFEDWQIALAVESKARC